MAENYFYSSLSGQEIENRLIGGVLFNTDQTLTSSQKAVARANIGAGESNSTFKVLGYFNTLAEMQAALQTLPKLGDAYGIGTESPYDVYVYAMHMEGGQAVSGWVNQGPIDTSAAAFDDNDISTRTGWTSSKIASELTNVQRRLVIDDVPTLGSGNPVASGGVAVKMEWKKIVSENVSVPVNRWTSSTKYDGYGFRAQIPIENVTADMIPEVVLGQTEVSAGTFASIAETYNGGVYIYASEVPSAAITIPTIIVWRGDTGDGSDIPVIRVDPTLTVSGAAADAKAAGDAIRANASELEDLQALTNRKAGMLVDTASGAIASFVPDATIPDLLGVSVAVEPVQDLHGYDSPWPAGGGKNLYNANVLNNLSNNGITVTVSNGTITLNGTATANAFFSVSGAGLPSGNYVFTFNNPVASSGVHVSFRNSGGQYFSDTNANAVNKSAAFTGEPNTIVLYINGGTTLTDFVVKPQLETGSTATSWTPYSNLCPISGWSAVEVGLTDEQYFDPTTTVIGRNWTGSASADRAVNEFPVNGGETLTLYANQAVVDTFWQVLAVQMQGTNQIINQTIISGLNTLTIRNNCNRVIIQFAKNGDITASDFAGTVISVSERINTYTIAIGQTVYGGTLDVVNGTMTVDRAKIVYNGSETWYPYGTQGYYISRNDMVKAMSYQTMLKSDILPTYPSNYGQGFLAAKYGITGWANNSSPNQNYIYVKCGEVSATADQTVIKAWLQENPLTVTYELATPITIQLDPVTISTISGQTNNVWADAGVVTVKYAADIKAYIDRLNQSPEDDMIANTLIAANKYFTVNNRLFLSTASIAAGAQIIPGHNCTETSLVEALNALNA